jgi:penicillin-binding protein 2
MSSPDPIRSLDEPFDEPADPARRRLLGLGIGAGVAILGLSTQLWNLQLFNGSTYRDLADNNRFRLSRLDSARGVIFDRNDQALARNKPSYVVAVVPADLPRDRGPVLRRLSRLLGMPVARIEELIRARTGDPFSPAPLRSGVDARLAYLIEERHAELPGVQVVIHPIREYVDGRLASHVIGYVGKLDAEEYERVSHDPVTGYGVDDDIGKMGLELVRETELRGKPGQKRAEVDSAGRELRVLGVDGAETGINLHLTIDLPLQREITRLLLEHMPRAEAASAVAIDPRDGQLLALVHLPSFDNNAFSRELTDEEFKALMDDPGRPLMNGAIAATYPPGSVFQLVTALAALHQGAVKPETKVDCAGALIIPNRLAPGGAQRIPCWATHGPQDCATALGSSCNVYFYQAGEQLDIDPMADWAGKLGLGFKSGIELPNEVEGFVPTRGWKRRTYREDWFTGDTYNVAIGQGYVTATPLQVANLIATIANGGNLFRPQVVFKSTGERGDLRHGYRPDLVRDLHFDPAKLQVVQRGMRYGMQIGRTENGTSYTGTSWDSDLRDLAIAGKTGTAEFGEPEVNGARATHGWFAGYAPFDQPQMALSVFLKRGHGARDAARIARRVFAFYFGVAED